VTVTVSRSAMASAVLDLSAILLTLWDRPSPRVVCRVRDPADDTN
jgi:hypothetical protein